MTQTQPAAPRIPITSWYTSTPPITPVIGSSIFSKAVLPAPMRRTPAVMK